MDAVCSRMGATRNRERGNVPEDGGSKFLRNTGTYYMYLSLYNDVLYA
jgi:hypothetical protein